jgi:hypothetical protein
MGTQEEMTQRKEQCKEGKEVHKGRKDTKER